MRIDYFIVSEKLKDRIIACEMHGKGIELQGIMLCSCFLVSCVILESSIPSTVPQLVETFAMRTHFSNYEWAHHQSVVPSLFFLWMPPLLKEVFC